MDSKKTILIVEDDKYVLNFISMRLKKEGYAYYIAKTVEEAKSLFYANHPDLILLDLGLPDGDGSDVIASVREISKVPIIVVSARLEEEEKIRVLDAGADDYVTKPFYMGELMARIRAAFRRSACGHAGEPESVFECDYLRVDNEKREVTVDGKEIHLTPIEFRILNLLVANRGKVLTHHYIVDQIWGRMEGVEPGNLRVFVATLRRKIEKEPGNPRFILTEAGVGYRFKS